MIIIALIIPNFIGAIILLFYPHSKPIFVPQEAFTEQRARHSCDVEEEQLCLITGRVVSPTCTDEEPTPGAQQ